METIGTGRVRTARWFHDQNSCNVTLRTNYTMTSSYTIHRVCHPEIAFDSPMWRDVPALAINQFHPRSSDHRPRTLARIAYDPQSLCVRFDVEDRYVRSVATGYQQPVCRDSCVEFFVQPKPDRGYFNLETNCGGTLLLYYIEDPTRTPTGFAKFTPVPLELASQITILHSLPCHVDPEITTPTSWSLAYRLPLSILEHYVGRLGPLPGQSWRGNLYKCGDHTSHPHWASWSPVGDQLNFHQPARFGDLCFL